MTPEDYDPNEAIPSWSCRRWGDYEHDWLDCPECLEAYEKWLDQHELEVNEAGEVKLEPTEKERP